MIDRRHRPGPAEEVALQRLEQLLDVGAAEAAAVRVVVDVARRRADEHQRADPPGLADRGQHADHRADRVPDEDGVGQVERAAQLQHVVGVGVERAVPLRVVGRQVRAAGADVVEQDHAMVGLERGRDEPPHPLVAAEPVREQHRAGVRDPGLGDVMTLGDAHASDNTPRSREAVQRPRRRPGRGMPGRSAESRTVAARAPLTRREECGTALRAPRYAARRLGTRTRGRAPCAWRDRPACRRRSATTSAVGRKGSAMTRSPARAATTTPSCSASSTSPASGRCESTRASCLERAAVGAARGPDDDGWIEGGVLGHGGSWGRRGKDLDLSVRHAAHQHK